jgi:hypothetical protein
MKGFRKKLSWPSRSSLTKLIWKEYGNLWKTCQETQCSSRVSNKETPEYKSKSSISYQFVFQSEVSVHRSHILKNAVFWDMAPCRFCVNRRFGGTYRDRGSSMSRMQPPAQAGSSIADFSTLEMEAIRSSETSVHTKSTWRHFPEDSILHSHRSENLKSYNSYIILNNFLIRCLTSSIELLWQKMIKIAKISRKYLRWAIIDFLSL